MTSHTSSPPASTSPPTRLRERLGLLARPGADDEIRPAAHDLVAVRLQLVGEVVGLLVRVALDAHLPGREAAGDELLLDVRQVGLRVPAVLVVEPVLEDDLARRRRPTLRARRRRACEPALLPPPTPRRRTPCRHRATRRAGRARAPRPAPSRASEMSMPSRSRKPRACSSASSMRMRQSSRAIGAQPSLPRALAPGDRRARRPCGRSPRAGIASPHGGLAGARPALGAATSVSSSGAVMPVGSASDPSRVVRALAQAEAGERERLVAHAADPVRGLPRPAALDRLARVEDAEPAEPGDVRERRRLGRRNVDGLPEDGAGSSESGRRSPTRA